MIKRFFAFAMLGGPLTAMAAPFLFTFHATIDKFPFDPDLSPPLPGVNAGDAAVVKVIADNGGQTLVDQRWEADDITSATVAVGASYSGKFNAPFVTNSPFFKTDSTGRLVTTRFFDDDTNNEDSLGGSAAFMAASVGSWKDGDIRLAYFVDGLSTGGADTPENWSVSQVPEPGTLVLLGLGLAGLAATLRRKQ